MAGAARSNDDLNTGPPCSPSGQARLICETGVRRDQFSSQAVLTAWSVPAGRRCHSGSGLSALAPRLDPADVLELKLSNLRHSG